jgi:hypothetical protein
MIIPNIITSIIPIMNCSLDNDIFLYYLDYKKNKMANNITSIQELENQATVILRETVDEDDDIDFEEEDDDIEFEEEDDGIEFEEEDDQQNPAIEIFGNKYDRDTAIVVFIILFIWCVIWGVTGLWRTLIRRDFTFIFIFVIFCVYMLAMIASSGRTSGGVVYELNILLTVEQMISILFGTIVLFTLFGHNLPIHTNCKTVIFRLSLSIVIILTTASLWVNVWTSGRSFRALRKFKQGIYNVSLTLFILIGLIYLKAGNSTDSKQGCYTMRPI